MPPTPSSALGINPRPRARWRRWVQWTFIFLVAAGVGAWVGRAWWLGPLVARTLAQTLHEQVGGRWQVEHVDGSYVTGLRVHGLTCLEPAPQSVIPRCRIGTVAVSYRLWRFFGAEPLLAIDDVVFEDLAITIDTTALSTAPISNDPPAIVMPTIPWGATVNVLGEVEIITSKGRVDVSQVQLNGELANLHFTGDVSLATQSIGTLQIDAQHTGASLKDGWHIESRTRTAAEEPLSIDVTLAAATPQVSAQMAAGKGTLVTCRDSEHGWIFHGEYAAAQTVPALRRLALALGVTLPPSGHFAVDGVRSDDGSVALSHGEIQVPGTRIVLEDAQWNATHGITALKELKAELHLAAMHPALATRFATTATLEVIAHVVDGQIDIQVTSHDLPWSPTVHATVSGQIASEQWRTAPLQFDLAAADASLANRIRMSLSGIWADLQGSVDVRATRLSAGMWQADEIDASATFALTGVGNEALIDGQWRLGSTAISVGAPSTGTSLTPRKLSLPLASSGSVRADATGLRVTVDTTAPLVVHGELTNLTPYTAETSWFQALGNAPFDGHWDLSDTDLTAFAPLLPAGLHLDGHMSGHGDVRDAARALRWSAALAITKANLGGRPPIPPLLDIDAAISADSDGITVTSLRARVGGGQLEISGSCPLPGQPGPLALAFVSSDALVFQRPDVRVRADANVHLGGTWNAPELKGRIHLTDLVATTPVSWFGGRDVPAADSPLDGLIALPRPWNHMLLELHLTGGQDAKKSLEIRNNVLVASLAVDVHLSGKAELPVASGEISSRNGRLALPFSSYRIDRAAVRFNPADPYDPVVEASASTQVQGYVLTVQISGTLRHPQIDVTSSPPLAPEDALVLASTGRLPAEMRRDGTSASAIGLALPFMGRELQRWVVGDGFADDDESIFDRFVVRYDEERSQRGLSTVRLEYQLGGRWHVYGERDLYEAYNLGLMWRWIFSDPARIATPAETPEETPSETLANWQVEPAAGVESLPLSASTLLKTIPARQRQGDEANLPAQLASAAQRMVDRLRQAGYLDAKVHPQEEGTVVKFLVTPGLPWEISATHLHGVPDSLKLKLETIVARGFANGTAPTPSRVSAVKSAVRSALIHAGYALPRVKIDMQREPQLESVPEATFAIANITVVPGLHYRFLVKPPTVDGSLPPTLQQRITDVCLDLNGENWTRRETVSLRAKVLEMLRFEGYAFATVVVRGDEPALLPDVECEVHIVTGQLVMLRTVTLSGFDTTSENYVRRRLRLEPGMPLRGDEPNAALNRLRRSGVARSITSTLKPAPPLLVGVVPEPQAAADHVQADLSIVAEETPPRSVELAAGYGSYEGARGSALFRDTNLFGWGRTWEIGGDASQRSYGGHTRIIDRDILGFQRTLSTRLSGGYRQEPSFDRTFYVSETSVRAPLTDWLDLRTSYTFEAERATDRAATVDDSADQGFVLNGVLNANVIWEGRDDRSLPTNGGMAELGFGVSDPTLGSQIAYVEWSSRLGWVLPVVDERLIVAAHVAGVVRRITDGAATLPIQYRLFLGGSTTVRSFGLNELSPVTPEGEALGGLTAGYANVEVRAKVSGNFHAAAFYDVGTVSERSWTLNGALGTAIGAGMRYYLPIGPLRIDAAYNPGERWAATRSYAIEGAIGFTF